jgi:cell wall-associated NlpC family hydrolase
VAASVSASVSAVALLVGGWAPGARPEPPVSSRPVLASLPAAGPETPGPGDPSDQGDGLDSQGAGPDGGRSGEAPTSAWLSGWGEGESARPSPDPAGVWTSELGGGTAGPASGGDAAGPASGGGRDQQPPAGEQSSGEAEAADRPVSCTREIDDLAQLRDVMLTSGPEEIICVRAPRTGPAALAAVAFARSQLGAPYRWGGNGRRDGGFDCSGLTSASYASAGVPIPRTAQAQYDAGPRLRPDEPIQPGDLVFFGSGPRGVGHVGLAVSATEMINAPDAGQVVSIGPIRRRDFVGATRPTANRQPS